MNYRFSCVLGLIGSILGMLISLMWLDLGTGFWGNVFGDAAGIKNSEEIPPSYFSYGFMVAGFQCLVPYLFFTVTLSKSLPKKLAANPRNNGLWLLMVGIGSVIVNLFLLLPCLLLIAAGTIVLKRKMGSERNV